MMARLVGNGSRCYPGRFRGSATLTSRSSSGPGARLRRFRGSAPSAEFSGPRGPQCGRWAARFSHRVGSGRRRRNCRGPAGPL